MARGITLRTDANAGHGNLRLSTVVALWLTLTTLSACNIASEVSAGIKERGRVDTPDGSAGDSGAVSDCSPPMLSQRITVQGSDQVDLLFVISNSPSMVEEQQKLAQVLPAMAKALATGEVSVVDASGQSSVRRLSPVVSLHVGVVTGDMGVSGVEVSPACHDFGDDGLLRLPTACSAASRGAGNYLDFEAGQGDSERLASDVGCLSATGTAGCRFPQPLEAALKALTPSTSNLTFSRNTNGHGDLKNTGFLRPDSLLAIVLVTDQDDCSAPDSSKELFELNPKNPKFQHPDRNGNFVPDGLSTRCALHSEDGTLHAVARYIEGLKSLRSPDPSRIIFAAITGVPMAVEGMVTKEGIQDFDQILGLDAMLIRFSDQAASNTIEGTLPDPACSSPSARAAPARRIVQTAKGFGENGLVRSICSEDFSAITLAITDRIASKLSGACMRRALTINADQRVSCSLVETLPAGMTTCDPAKGRTPTDLTGAPIDDGKEHLVCLVNQVAVDEQAGGCNGLAVERCLTGALTVGWYYDDFSDEFQRFCLNAPARIAFSPGARPRDGSALTLRCDEQCYRDAHCPTGYVCETTRCVPASCRVDMATTSIMDAGLTGNPEVGGGTSSGSGTSGGSTSSRGTSSDSGTSGSGTSSSSDCRGDALPDPSPAPGRTSFTQADWMACMQKCGQDQACSGDVACAGYEAFTTCASKNSQACSAAQNGRCRSVYESFACCANAAGCAGPNGSCSNGVCSTEQSEYDKCLSSDTTCLRSAFAACWATP